MRDGPGPCRLRPPRSFRVLGDPNFLKYKLIWRYGWGMSNTDSSASDVQPDPDSAFAAPLDKWQRIAAATIGLLLTVGGAVSVFRGKSQAGSVALLLGGLAFLLIAVIGQSVHRVRFKEMEVFFGIRQREQVSDLASRLPHGDAVRLMQLLQETTRGTSYAEHLLTLVDSLLFEARVRDAVTESLGEAERAEVHPEADVGEPLLHVVRPDGARLGIFAMFAPSESGTLPTEFDDDFMEVLPTTGCDAVILITCVRDGGYLAALAERIRQETGLPVAIESWRPKGEARSLRPSIDRLGGEIRATDAVPPAQSRTAPGPGARP